MTLIVQITDPHLRDDGADPCHDPARAMRAAFAEIAALDLRPEAIVLTGDIIDRSAGGYAHVMPLLRAAPVPLLPLPGNHDRAGEFRAALGDRAPFQRDHLSFAVEVGALLLIGLDSTLPDGRGGVDAARLDWLAGVLAAATRPAVLALHHPPFPTRLPHLDRAGFPGAEELAAQVRGSAVHRVIAGHSHRGISALWAGVPASTAIGIGHGLDLSLTGAKAHGPHCTPPGYELHHWQAGGLVSHQMRLATSATAPDGAAPHPDRASAD